MRSRTSMPTDRHCNRTSGASGGSPPRRAMTRLTDVRRLIPSRSLPREQGRDRPSPLLYEQTFGRDAVAAVHDVEGDGLLRDSFSLEAAWAYGVEEGADDVTALVQQVPRDPRGGDVRAGVERVLPR